MRATIDDIRRVRDQLSETELLALSILQVGEGINRSANRIADCLGGISDAIEGIDHSVDRVASALRSLGTADAATNLGAIEYLAVQVSEVAKAIVTMGDSIAGTLEK